MMKKDYIRRNWTQSPLTLVMVGFIVTMALVLLGTGWSTAFGGTVPDANSSPTNLQAVGVATNQIDLYWTDNATDELGFKIERKTGQNGTWIEIATIPANGGPGGTVPCGGTIPCGGNGTILYHDTNGLQPGTLYYYRVRAYENPTGPTEYSLYSNEANAYTLSSLVVTKSLDDGTPGSLTYVLGQVDANNKVVTFQPGLTGVLIPTGGTIPTVPTGASIAGTCDTANATGPVVVIDARNASPASKANGLTLSGGATFYGLRILGTKIKALTGGNHILCSKVAI